MAMNPDYKKTLLRDNFGKTLLPRTTASMVSEEPDRRFVDNIEKTLLNNLTEYSAELRDVATMLNEIRLMADHIDEIVNLLDGREVLQEIGENGELFTQLIPIIPELNSLLHGSAQVRSTNTSILYRLDVDDVTDPDSPVLKLVAVDETPETTSDVTDPLLPPVEGESLQSEGLELPPDADEIPTNPDNIPLATDNDFPTNDLPQGIEAEIIDNTEND